MNDKIKLTQDNSEKLTVFIKENDLEREAKIFFHWRHSTKRYNSIKARIFGLGSSAFDGFVKYLYNKGYQN